MKDCVNTACPKYGAGYTDNCGKPREYMRDCEDYLTETKTEKSVPLNAGLSCDCCGGKMVYIRGRHPGMDNRLVCPTCMAETLDDIKARLRTNYGQAEQGAR